MPRATTRSHSRIARPNTLFLIAVLTTALPCAARAERNSATQTPESDGSHWGITIWGLSYHTNRNADYDEHNWGLGVRYYRRPQWRWLGKSHDNRLFVEGDALRNSNGGLVLPLSAAAEYRIPGSPDRCKLFAVGALTLAYYRYPAKDRSEFKVGPVPGFAVGCGPIKVNISAVLRRSSSPLAALVASMTILF
jgi:hypothetical protein